ncbi:MAG: biotin synthase BioB [Gammaproteobacteria bacterium]|nr:MAG: biotin synthase BioB [Gammaproteobacteria bacterium]
MAIRHDWSVSQAQALLDKPLMDLLFEAQQVHRRYHNPNEIQVSTLLSIKTGACPEDCKYCPQSARYQTHVKREKLLEIEQVLQAAKAAKQNGSTRFCMGAAWRNPQARDMPYLEQLVKEVKSMGMETCMTLGMLSKAQAETLADAGLDYYNHNVDTSSDYYSEVITTRTYQDRLDTLEHVREAGMKVCSGGIIGLGESVENRAQMLMELANLPTHPQSVPINRLVKCEGTPYQSNEAVDDFDFIRVIAAARIMMPKSMVRLSAGRESMNEQMQAMCFMAGANSIFYGCKLLTTPNPAESQDHRLFKKLGLSPAKSPYQYDSDTTSDLSLSPSLSDTGNNNRPKRKIGDIPVRVYRP